MQKHWNGHVVRQVRHECPWFGGQFGDVQGVADHQVKRGVRTVEFFYCPRQTRSQKLIEFDGDHRVTRLQEPQSERAQAGPHLGNGDAGFQLCFGDDHAHRVGVDHEVLAALFGGAQAQFRGDLAHSAGGQEGSHAPSL